MTFPQLNPSCAASVNLRSQNSYHRRSSKYLHGITSYTFANSERDSGNNSWVRQSVRSCDENCDDHVEDDQLNISNNSLFAEPLRKKRIAVHGFSKTQEMPFPLPSNTNAVLPRCNSEGSIDGLGVDFTNFHLYLLCHPTIINLCRLRQALASCSRRLLLEFLGRRLSLVMMQIRCLDSCLK